jgi:branched-chain amino acid transport system substrate-binding protein
MSLSTKAIRSRSRKATISGIALLAGGALALSGCAAGGGGTTPSEEPSNGGAAPIEDLTLKIGTALPVTGSLAFLGPPEIAGVNYAAAQINEADLGITVEIVEGDSGDLDNKAYETEIPRILSEDVSAIVGAASSGVSLQFIDQVVGAGVIQFSPANTSADFSTYDDNGLYWRTAPSDILQGDVLGNLIAEDGHETLGMIVLNDSYGTGLASFTQEAFEAAGGEVVAQVTYNTGDTNFTPQISEVLAADPDAIALITFEEVVTMLPDLVDGFDAENLYFVDGNLKNFSDRLPAGMLTGAKGTLPGLTIDDIASFTDELNEWWTGEGNPALEDYSYAAESYDAVIMLALAAMQARSIEGADIAAELQSVSGGVDEEGEQCTTFSDCAQIIVDGGQPNYDGVSGPIAFDENGDPTKASIGIYQYGEDNNYAAYEG